MFASAYSKQIGVYRKASAVGNCQRWRRKVALISAVAFESVVLLMQQSVVQSPPYIQPTVSMTAKVTATL